MPNLLLLMPFSTTTKLTPPLTMPILLLSRNLQLSTLLISPLPVTSNRLPQQTPLYFAPSRTCLTTPPSSHVPHLLTGLSTMDTYIIKDECIYHPLLGPLCSTPSIPLPSRAIIERDFWWPGLSMFVNNFIAGCAICQWNKARTHPVIPPLSPIKSSSSLPFKQLSIDLITNLPLSHGHNSLMVMVKSSFLWFECFLEIYSMVPRFPYQHPLRFFL